MANGGTNITELVAETNEAMVHSPEWYGRLRDAINNLLANDFGRLVQVLYQADVSEEKLKQLLKDNVGTDASAIIANLLMQRQLQKIEARRSFKQNTAGDGGEERW